MYGKLQRVLALLLVWVMMFSTITVPVQAEAAGVVHDHEHHELETVSKSVDTQALVTVEKQAEVKETKAKVKFAAGYATLDADTRLFSNVNLNKQVDRVTKKSVVYAYKFNEKKNAIAVAYVRGDKVKTAWVKAARVDFMTKTRAKNYKKNNAASPYKYKGFPLVPATL